jgi:hypothetical protein
VFERAAVLRVSGDTGGAESVIADPRFEADRGRGLWFMR